MQAHTSRFQYQLDNSVRIWRHEPLCIGRRSQLQRCSGRSQRKYGSNNVDRAIRLVSLLLIIGQAFCFAARADEYPSRLITLVVPFPAGGAADTVARLMAPRLGSRLGQTVVIENKPRGDRHHRNAVGRQVGSRWIHVGDCLIRQSRGASKRAQILAV